MESRGSSSREITDKAIAFVDAHRDRKFFLWVHYYDPHLDYEPHPEVPDFGPSRVDLYDGEIRFTDLHLGRLLAHLRAAGLWDRTTIVVTGDHGEGFGEHGVTEHGFDLYARADQGAVHRARARGCAPRRVRAPAGHVDIAPTLVNLARGARRAGFHRALADPGLVRAAGAPTPTRAPVFQEVTSERGKKRALVTATRHLIWNAAPGDTTECYDRARDPGRGARHLGAAATATGRARRSRARSSAWSPGSRCRAAPPRSWRSGVTPAGRHRRRRPRTSLDGVARRRRARPRVRPWRRTRSPAGRGRRRHRTTSPSGQAARPAAGGCSSTWRGRAAFATWTTSLSTG